MIYSAAPDGIVNELVYKIINLFSPDTNGKVCSREQIARERYCVLVDDAMGRWHASTSQTKKLVFMCKPIYACCRQKKIFMCLLLIFSLFLGKQIFENLEPAIFFFSICPSLFPGEDLHNLSSKNEG